MTTEANNVKTEEIKKPLTFTERFNAVEQTVANLAYMSSFQNKATRETINRLAELENLLKAVVESITAIMKLSQEGKTFSEENIATEIVTLAKASVKEKLTRDLQSGEIVKAEAIENDMSIVEFESSKENGIVLVAALAEEYKKDIIGKKIGDNVGDLTILGVYQYAKTPETAQQSTSSTTGTGN